MSDALDTTAIIEFARDKASIDDHGIDGYEDSDILEYCDGEILTEIVPMLMKQREGYFKRDYQVSCVAGTADYRIPKRSIGIKLDALRMWDGSVEMAPLTQLADSQLEHFAGKEEIGVPTHYTIEGSYVRLYPRPDSAYTLRMPFFIRPGQLKASTRWTTVQSVDSTTQITTAANLQTVWGASPTLDVHADDSGAELKVYSAGATVSGTTVTFSAAIDGSVYGTRAVEAGDYVCLECEAALPALPVEFHTIVGRLGACGLLEALEDIESLKIQKAIVERKLAKLEAIFSDRVESDNIPVRGAGHFALFGQYSR